MFVGRLAMVLVVLVHFLVGCAHALHRDGDRSSSAAHALASSATKNVPVPWRGFLHLRADGVCW